MDDESVSLPAYVTQRNGVYQYVRWVPEDLVGLFAGTRIQRSLRTRLPGEARHRAAAVDLQIEQEFDAARRRAGLEAALLPTVDWTWSEWQKVIDYLKARWLRDDLKERLGNATGEHFSQEARGRPLWLDDRRLRSAIDRHRKLKGMTVTQYDAEGAPSLRRTLSVLGVPLPIANPYREEFMAAALRAEVEALELIFKRESGETIEYLHPDMIEGPWKCNRVLPEASAASWEMPTEKMPASGKALSLSDPPRTLSDCIAEWKRERVRLRKKIDTHLVNDMQKTVARFASHSGVAQIGQIERHHLVRFRDSLFDEGRYKVATINKEVGFVTMLISLAATKGWIEKAIDGGIYIEVPADEDKRESYTTEEINTLFAHPVCTAGARSKAVKAGGELQFWLPLISCCHGFISSEILQLGPDTIVRHPGTEVWCFRVTTAGSRSIKAYSRERFVPIRNELLDLGLLDLVTFARFSSLSTLWASIGPSRDNVSMVSNYFSAHWTSFARKQLKEPPERTSLYSFRHTFKDELDRREVPLEVKRALLGHADGGTTGRYGTKKAPRPVDIGRLKAAIDFLEWEFLTKLMRPR